MKNSTDLTQIPGITIHSLARIGNGKAGEIFLVNGEIVFKVPLSSDTSDELELEYEVLGALQGKVDIAIPKPLYFGTLPDGRKVLGESLVPGIQFTQELYEELSQPEKDAVFAQMGDIFHQIHSADVPRIKNIDEYDNNAPLADFYEHYTDTVKNALTHAQRVQVQKIAADFAEAVKADPVPVVLCHGDLHFANLNYDPVSKKICGLLDFGVVNYNDPLNDMRYFWSDTVIKMLRSYPGNIGANAGARHLFYCMCNLIEAARGDLENGGDDFINRLRKVIFQEPLSL
ncbi:MAG: aminoglycoside phosphotransferase family protein [Oscillospiraceae bacterium]|nr:aminoglycoside phosphotransferase family protein [Oscillospiraceae bacterium]